MKPYSKKSNCYCGGRECCNLCRPDRIEKKKHKRKFRKKLKQLLRKMIKG